MGTLENDMIAVAIPEAETKLSEIVSRVETADETVFLLRLGRAVARIVPMPRSPRDASPDPALAPLDIKGDLFSDNSADWESA